MNDEGVCRTAPATPGLLKIGKRLKKALSTYSLKIPTIKIKHSSNNDFLSSTIFATPELTN